VNGRPRYDEGMGAAGVEWLIAQVLLWGGLLSGLLVLSGLVLYFVQGGFQGHVIELHWQTRPGAAGHPTGVFVSVREVLGALSARPADPLAIIALGLVLLLVTPVLGVAVAVPGFLRDGDRQYAGIAVIVLSMLLVSLLLAGGAG
jgi:uncharacterized membrane protein